MKYTVKSDKPYSINIKRKVAISDQFEIDVDGKSYDARIKEYHPNGRLKTLVVNNHVIPVEIQKYADGFPRTIYLNGVPFDVEIEKIKSLPQTIAAPDRVICGNVKSGLPGQVLAIFMQVGETVEQGQPLLILESMKMENEILAPKSGTVVSILVTEGQMVMKDQLIAEIG